MHCCLLALHFLFCQTNKNPMGRWDYGYSQDGEELLPGWNRHFGWANFSGRFVYAMVVPVYSLRFK